MSSLDGLPWENAAYVEELYRKFLDDPESVDPSFREAFRSLESSVELLADPLSRTGAEGADLPPELADRAASRGIQIDDLVHTFREYGHLVARLDPLGTSPDRHPYLDLDQFGLDPEDLDRRVSCRSFRGLREGTVREHLEALRETYCGSVGVEYMDLMVKEQRDWLQERMEPVRNRPQLDPESRRLIFRHLMAADVFEESLHRMYLGAKRFSVEGGTTLLVLLHQLIREASRRDVEQIVLGMAHRGRLNVLARVMGKPLEHILAEFEGRPLASEIEGYGDVKYHLGYSSDYEGPGGSVHLSLAFNPSHLEIVDPVVEGIVRAKQDQLGDRERRRVVPVLIHGDAAFAGQGVVAETLCLSGLAGYTTGGTVHVIVNNQIGFTAEPSESRSTRYASDIAKTVRAPVFHVNGDDPEAVAHVGRVALGFRQAFRRDVVVDLVCYRKYGHNETDDASFTQPVMARRIAEHPAASHRYADRLVADGVLTREDVDGMVADEKAKMEAAREVARELPEQVTQRLGGAWQGIEDASGDWSADTRVAREVLERIARSWVDVPEGFRWHPRLERILRSRAEAALSDGLVDWGAGEALAFGTLLLEGTPVRLSGQDSARGTFSHRHATYVDHETGERFTPLARLDPGQARFEVVNSPLSEEAVLGFEYGYSSADPWSLVLWEAQFGDFVNGAQVIIDQLIASCEYKWGRMSGVVLLLPHGLEGQGPEHSSARPERFLELCSENNMQLVYPTTPAQFFHGLREQCKRRFRKPLIVMTPKSLLRHPKAVSTLDELAEGRFRPVVDDDSVADPGAIRRVLVSSGKIFYPLAEGRDETGHGDVALVRLERLYPFPLDELRSVLAGYPNASQVLWVQEEPRNQGAWRHIEYRLVQATPEGATFGFAGRDSRATPATGSLAFHRREEAELVAKALDADARSRVVRRRQD